jgi:hypothetical protein
MANIAKLYHQMHVPGDRRFPTEGALMSLFVAINWTESFAR